MPKALGIAYLQEGEGRDVLLLHGWGASKESFAILVKHLSGSFRVTAVDFNGFGESDRLKTPFNVSAYANRLEFFAGFIGIKPAAVLCHSFGGRVAIKLLAENPGFCRKLILVDSAGIRPKRGLRYYGKVYTYKILKRLCRKNPERLRKRFASSDYAALDPVMQTTFKNVVNEDLEPYLCGIRAETLIVWGEDDAETPLYMAKRLQRGIAGSGLAVIPGAGHFCFLDRPQHFLRIIDCFLEPEIRRSEGQSL